jgi:hypothetical protein
MKKQHPQIAKVQVHKGNRKHNVKKGAVYDCTFMEYNGQKLFDFTGHYKLTLIKGKGAGALDVFVRYPKYWERQIVSMSLPNWNTFTVEVLEKQNE